MTRDEIIASIRSAAPALKAEGVTRLGSQFSDRARGDARSDSDLDVLVEVEPDSRFSALNLVGVEHIIRDATGIEVQATMRRSLEPRMAERIADDIIEVF
jgi:predicted nucleotidyltransferase